MMKHALKPHPGFTLVELLVTITILVILASVSLYAMFGVQQMAKTQRAKAQVQRLHEIVAAKWESFESRRLAPTGRLPQWFRALWSQWRANGPIPNYPFQTVEEAWPVFDRLWKIRELMRMELPDRASDLRDPNPASSWGATTSDSGIPFTAEAQYYLRFIAERTFAKTGKASTPRWGDDAWDDANAGAECLYMIVSRAEIGDANGLEFFSEDEIGDKDNDGMPEIWDPWGNPIEFVRWPTGFPSPLQSVPHDPLTLRPSMPPYNRDLYPADALDPWGVDAGGYFHFSLIVSAGPDGRFGLALRRLNSAGVDQIDYSNRNETFRCANYPTQIFRGQSASTENWRMAEPLMDDEGDRYSDNIHNHLIETSTR